MSCNISVESSFGPRVIGCLSDFDFTLLFEETVLSIAPQAIALLIILWRICSLERSRHTRKVRGGSFLGRAKVFTYSAYSAAQIGFLIAVCVSQNPSTRASAASAAIALLFTSAIGYLSILEHMRSVRPSVILETYFSVSLLLDIVRCRTLWQLQNGRPEAYLFIACTGWKALLLVLESIEKRKLLLSDHVDYPPEAVAGTWSRNTLAWLWPLLIRGSKHELCIDELAPNDEALLPDTTMEKLQKRLDRCDRKNGNYLFWVYVVHYKRSLAAGILPRLCLAGLRFAQPFLINATVTYMVNRGDPASKYRGPGLIVAYVLVYIGMAFANLNCGRKIIRVITMFRGTLVNLLFQKTLEMSTASLEESKPMTLMSADVARISGGLSQVHEVWSNVVEIAIALWLIERELKWGTLGAGIVTIICILLAGIVASGTSGRQKRWLEKIQRRVASTASMLGSMKGVKMSGLTDDMSVNIRTLRATEITVSLGYRKLLVYIACLAYAGVGLTGWVAFAVYGLTSKFLGGRGINETTVFMAMPLVEILVAAVMRQIDSFSGIMSVWGAFQRIGHFLATPSHVDPRLTAGNSQEMLENSFALHTSIPDEKLRFSTPLTLGLEKIAETKSMEEASNCMVAQVSKAGYHIEKPPVLECINIEFKKAYHTMIIGPVGCGKSTLLKTLLGETPVAIGRIMKTFDQVAYCSQTPFLINGTIKSNIIGAYEWDKRRYNTATHVCALEVDFGQLQAGDQSIVGSQGITLSGGQKSRIALARAVYSRIPVVFLDDIFAGLDSDTEEKVFSRLFGKRGLFRQEDTTVVLVTNAVHRLSAADHIIALDSNGRIVEQGSFDTLNSGSGYMRSLSLSKRKATLPDNVEEALATIELPPVLLQKTPDGIDRRRSAGDLTVYKYYISAFGWYKWSLLMLFAPLFGFGRIYPPVWVQRWGAYNMAHPNEELGYYIGVYGIISLLAVFALFVACWHLIVNIVPLTARKMHAVLLRTVLNAPLSFFATTDVGVTLNRFGQDLELIDLELPLALINCIMMFSIIAAQTILIAVTGKYVGAILPICVGIVYGVQHFYLQTSRQIRLLDIEAKAPLFSQFLDALGGLETIRAFGWGSHFLDESRRALELSQRPAYLLYCIQRWLGLVLDLVVAGIAIVLITLAVVASDINPHYLGLALINLVPFSSNLKFLIASWTVLETSIGAVSRVRAFELETESENFSNDEERKAPPGWPENGSIEFNGISAAYRSSEKNVLKNISFCADKGQRIGICGRTGSGKSSLTLALFRMLDLNSGNITIDGADISTMSRQEVRSHLTAIPQEPYFLAGNVRLNVDPFQKASDDEIIRALIKVQLWDLVEKKGGLDVELSTDFFSHGQRQLLCLARAMVRKSCILVLDEATSSVDVKTDELMQTIIRSEFPTQTIIAVAHRLHTILDFDKVAVLADGKLVEFAAPRDLLARPGSAFRELWIAQKGEEDFGDETETLADSERRESAATGISEMTLEA